jgi:hypothetical protein
VHPYTAFEAFSNLDTATEAEACIAIVAKSPRIQVKCSGIMPCSACVANGGTCVFDDKYRGRRRPRSRPPPQRVTHNLAPADSTSGQAPNQQAQNPTGTSLRARLPPLSDSAQDIAGTTLHKATPRPLSDPSQECTTTSLLNNPETWIDGLRNILSNMQQLYLEYGPPKSSKLGING